MNLVGAALRWAMGLACLLLVAVYLWAWATWPAEARHAYPPNDLDRPPIIEGHRP